MPITLTGTGTITGISAGGLPDGSIAKADLSATGTADATTFLTVSYTHLRAHET